MCERLGLTERSDYRPTRLVQRPWRGEAGKGGGSGGGKGDGGTS